MKLMFHGQPVFDVGPLVKEVTQAEYDAMPSEQRSDTLFVITDKESSAMANVTVTAYETDDGWYVRKWSDGYVEMSYQKVWDFAEMGTTFSKNNYGAWTTQTAWFVFPDYPVPLVQVYSIIKGLNGSANGFVAREYSIEHGLKRLTAEEESLIRPARILLSSTNTGQPPPSDIYGQPVVSCHVTGRWK